ncbi:acyl carrier protein [Fodinicola feengrottensis]|uniref:Carrier domain-containing protein n=1 Tax=Fodinicola feengrottensis TaxID=435914 RepID=A0ABN2G6E1_9ACTN|nr:acyl carrier protein [Fodinicola feengrottensis]
MSERTLTELRELMIASAGVGEDELRLGGDILDTPFTDLDLDSLAVLEIASRVERDWGVSVSDAVANGFKTPRMVLDFVNNRTAVR